VSHRPENMVSLQVLMVGNPQMVYQVFTLRSTVQISRRPNTKFLSYFLYHTSDCLNITCKSFRTEVTEPYDLSSVCIG
jgi:hypothetical protein